MKRLFCIILCVIMLTSLLPTVANAYVSKADGTDLLGDADGDGEITSRDSLQIKSLVAGFKVSVSKSGADIDGDGAVTSRDAFMLKAKFAGSIDSLCEDYKADVKRIIIDGTDIKDFVITYPDGANENVKFAASELCDYIEKATDLTLPVEAGSKAPHRFVFENSAELGDEGVDITVENGCVYLTGGEKRGCMYAAYDFLERYLGFVFINAENEYLVAKNYVEIFPGTSFHHIPKIKDRDSQTWSYQSERIESALKMKISSWKNRGVLEKSEKYGYAVGYVGTAHTMSDFAPTYVPSNSSSTNWSNLNLYDECLENVLKKIDKTLSRGYTCERISVSPMDNNDYCTCRYCANFNKTEKSYMGAQLTFINKLAADVEKVYPDVHIMTTAYWYARKPPENLKPAKNVDILFCWAGCNNHPFDGSCCYEAGNRLYYNNIKESQYFEKWCEICDTVYVWIYATSYTGALAQPAYIDHLKADVKYLADHGVYGIYCEGYYGTSDNYKDGNCFDLLTMYLFAKCMYEPDMTDEEYDRYTDEFLMLYYGDGFEYVKQYLYMNIEATDALGKCSANNCDIMFDQMSLDYYTEHAEEMFTLIDTALTMTKTEEEADHLAHLAASVYWLCLVGTADYMDGTPAEKALYAERYGRLYSWMMKYNITNLDDETGNFHPGDDTVMNPYEWNLFTIYHHKKDSKDPMANFG